MKRYLNGEPILARPVGRLERSVRWCRRNPVVASLTALAFVLLISGTALSSYFAVVAKENAVRAKENEDVANRALAKEKEAIVEIQKQRDDLREAVVSVREERENARQNLESAKRAVDTFFTRVSESTLLNMPDMQGLRTELLDEGRNYYYDFLKKNEDDPTLRAELAAAHFRVAQSNFNGETYTLALTVISFSKGFAILEELLHEPEGSVEWGSIASGVYKGRMRFAPGEKPTIPSWVAVGILPIVHKACEAWERLVIRLPDSAGVKNDLAGLYNVRALVQHSARESEKAIGSYEDAIKIWEELLKLEPGNVNYQSEIAIAYANMTKVYTDRFDNSGEADDLDQAIRLQKKSLKLHLAIVDSVLHPPPSFVIDLAAASRDFSKLHASRNEFEKALEICRKATEILEEHFGGKGAYERERDALRKLMTQWEQASKISTKNILEGEAPDND